MSSIEIFTALGEFLEWTFGIFEVIGNSFNYFLLLSGFSCFIYWMSLQKRFNKEAENDPNKLK